MDFLAGRRLPRLFAAGVVFGHFVNCEEMRAGGGMQRDSRERSLGRNRVDFCAHVVATRVLKRRCPVLEQPSGSLSS